MELWIRSQDKESLLMIKKVFYHCTCNEMKSLGEHYIGNKEWVGDKDYTLLGTYKTKERALEVLDEIQGILNPMLMFKNIAIDEKTLKNIRDEGVCFVSNDAKLEPTCVYEMPEE